MTVKLVLTVIATDRSGLVGAIADTIAGQGGNWMQSRMARLGGQFAGILEVAVPDAAAGDKLLEALRGLEGDGLRVLVASDDAAPTRALRTVWLELTGHDRPGIVRDVTRAIAGLGVNIEELSTECANASMAGGELFQATARLGIPDEVSLGQLRDVIEALADEMMVDFTLDDDA